MKKIFNPCRITLLVSTLILCCAGPAAKVAAQPKQVLFFSKSSGFEHSVIKKNGDEPSLVEKVLADIGKENNIQFTFTKDGSVFTPENIAKYDAFFFYTTGILTERGGDHNPPMTQEGKAAFLDAIRNGKGFIGSHAATDTFHSANYRHSQPYKSDGDDADPYVKMIGAEFIVHGGQQTAHLICTDPKFPGLNDFPADFAPNEEWYSLKNFAPNLHVLLVQDTSTMHGGDICYKRPNYPETWAHMYGQGRVFYTSMGHREDIWTNNAAFRQVLVGGINWAVRKADADVTPNIADVTPQADVMPPGK